MTFKARLSELQPSQLYICREKLTAVECSIAEGQGTEPVPVKELDGASSSATGTRERWLRSHVARSSSRLAGKMNRSTGTSTAFALTGASRQASVASSTLRIELSPPTITRNSGSVVARRCRRS